MNPFGNWVIYLAELARALGSINQAVLYGLVLKEQGHGRYGKEEYDFPPDGEWACLTAKHIEYRTGLSRTQQERARKRLRDLGILEEVRRGLPSRIYYRVLPDAASAFLSSQEGVLES